MIRTQIQLTETQAEAAKKAAAERGVSMAELIRTALEHELGQGSERAARFRRALAAAGKFRDREGATDVAVRHDDYLAEIYEEDLR